MRFDTITALATPPGCGGIAVIRVSGPDSLQLADRLFRGRVRPSRRPGYTIAHGFLTNPATRETIDEVLISIFRHPRSYTGEDMVEISCHGGTAVSGAALDVLTAQGARLALPGEFTRRAVLNGKLNLTQAEAVRELVQARTDFARGRAIRQLAGALSDRVARLGTALDQVQSRLVALLEFGEELPATGLAPALRDLARVRRQLGVLLEQSRSSSLLRQGALVVIVGKPNVGKSSLFNRLAGEERAIVTEIPGTTRDCLEAELNLGGLPVRLVDTAGWRTRAGRIEALGRARAQHYAERADALLVILDSSRPLSREDEAVLDATTGQRRLLVMSKADLATRVRRPSPATHRASCLRVSAKTGLGIKTLTAWLRRQFLRPQAQADFVAGPRHVASLRRADAALANAQAGGSLDIRVQEVARARSALDELLGVRTSEAVLDEIFQEFCVGK